MGTKLRRRTSSKQLVRFKHKKKIRGKIEGTPDRPRVCVFRSNKNLYVQIVDDLKGHTLVSASSMEKELQGKGGKSVEGAKNLGQLVAKRAQANRITSVVFDRSGYVFHGKIKALADAARESGLKF